MIKTESKKTKRPQRSDIYIVLSGEFVAVQTLVIRNKAQGIDSEDKERSKEFLKQQKHMKKSYRSILNSD